MSTSFQPDAAEEKQPIQLDVKVESPEACVRRVVVTIPRSEVERYLKDAYDELVPEAQVPGFRSGRAPRKLVEKQFRDRVADQVKGSLLMDSLSQVTDSEEFSAISEPDFDYESIELPDEGEFKYQFTVEVRPEFETPDWKGLELKRPVEEISEEDIDRALDRVLSRYGSWEATDEPAEKGDRLLITAGFRHGDRFLSGMDEERVRLSEVLSLSDARIPDFGEKMAGVKEGETRELKANISEEAVDVEMAGKEVDASIHVVEVLKLERPELTPSLLDDLGGFESEDELRSFVRDSLQRQADYRTEQQLREQVVEKLSGAVDFDLPEEMVRRQTSRELERKVLEFRRSGFDDETLRRYVNVLRQNARSSTETALRQHFVLEKIAEQEKIDAESADFDAEIALIAQQSDMPERRVRARLEKGGQMDALRNQIIERKVIDRIVQAANVTDEPAPKEQGAEEDEFAVYHSVLEASETQVIPEARYDDNTPRGPQPESERE